MTLRRSGPRTFLPALVATVAALALTAPLMPVASAATLAAPSGLAVANKNSSTPILSWAKVKKATGYQVQVDNDPAFATPDFAVNTVNFRAVPPQPLRPGANYWRVRALAPDLASSWSSGSFQVSPLGVPVPTAPGDGAVLTQPDNPPLLRWEGAQGALSYTVQVDGDADFIGAKSYSTKTTSLVVPDPLTVGTYYWRVIASKANGIVSVPSAAAHFSVQPLAAPTQTYPPNSVDFTVEDVVLDWSPVTGAKTYEVQVATDQAFTNVVDSRAGITGTRYSRPISLPNNQYWWRVRAIDLVGQATPWTTSQNGFRRHWPDTPTALYPVGTEVTPAAVPSDDPYLSWTPVQHASVYEIQMADDENFSTDVRGCTTALTTYTIFPGGNGVCRLDNGVNWWRVRPLDQASNGNVINGLYTVGQAFSWTQPVIPDAPGGTPFTGVTGTAIGVSGARIDDDGGCTLSFCGDVPATPVFDWDAQEYAEVYRVLVAEDADFTNVIQNFVTNESRLALTAPLLESSAGGSYYWYVIPCRNIVNNVPNTCGPSPQSVAGLPGVKSFRKVSPQVGGLTSSDPGASEITFAWTDYFTTNQSTVWDGETGNQSARTYRLQVDSEPSFSDPLLDVVEVDQATYTAFDRLYPEATLYWRVQALDSNRVGLPWSNTATLTKSSPAVNLTSPGNGATAPGTVPFTWSPQAFASSYTVEVYKNNDAAFSPINKVFGTTVATTAFAWNQAIPADGTPYTWRVRRTDSFGNIGPWSATARFTSLGNAPQLLAPGAGTWQPTAGPLFEWTEAPGAAAYVLELRNSVNTNVVSVPTTATAWAPNTALPTADYTWRVVARDAANQVLGTSANRGFRVDATPPAIKKIKPASRILKPKSLVIVVFTEPVKGVTKKSLYLTPEGKKKHIKAKVTLNKKKTKATIDAKKRFKPGTYIVHATPKIKDLRGNPLTGGSSVISSR